MAQASWDRRAEITSGKTIAQQGLAATGTDHRVEVGDTTSWERVMVWRMSP
jgi:hypothetical protein